MRRPQRARQLSIGVAAVLAITTTAHATIPDEVPDRIVAASDGIERGAVWVHEAPDRTPSIKTVDGDPRDWQSESPQIGGAAAFDAGEYAYADFVHDAFGADDGQDAERLVVSDAALALESRTARLEVLFQTAGRQGAPAPVGAAHQYGDTVGNDVGDLTEVRVAADGDDVFVLAGIANLPDELAAGLRVVLLADTDGAAHETERPIPGTALTTSSHDVVVILSSDGAEVIDLATQSPVTADASAAVDPTDWTNTVEASVPASIVAPDGTLRLSLFTARAADGELVPLNVAFRPSEPVRGYANDQQQAIALHAGTVDAFSAEIDLADLRRGRTQTTTLGPGYHERTFVSDPAISTETGEPNFAELDRFDDSVWQRYGLFIPTSMTTDRPNPATFWMHQSGGKAPSPATDIPRIHTQLGEEHGNIVVTPDGRGRSAWYEGDSHQDFFEVFDDVHELVEIDPARRYVSGYSMGGYATALFGFLYPDLFAAAYSQAAAFSTSNQGPLAYNANNLPFWIDISAQDFLVAGNQQMAAQLRSHGYRHVIQTFVAGEHNGQAAADEWVAGAEYLNRFRSTTTPRHVRYRVSESMIQRINDGRGSPLAPNTYRPDGAYWIDGISGRDGAVDLATVDATAGWIGGAEIVQQQYVAGPRPGDHTVPSVSQGIEWTNGPTLAVTGDLRLDLTNVATLTVDLDATAYNVHAGGTVTVVSDGPTSIRLRGLPASTTVTGDGIGSFDGADLVVDIAGSGSFALHP